MLREIHLDVTKTSVPFESVDHMTLRVLVSVFSFAAVCIGLASCQTVSKPAKSGFFSKKESSSTPYIAALQGGIIGRSGVKMSESDQQRALEAEYRALEAAPGGQPVNWSGRGVSGSVVASAPYQVGSQNCRQYVHKIMANNKETTARGAACRTESGSWSPLG